MGDKRNKHRRLSKKKFNLAGGIASKKVQKRMQTAYKHGVYLETVKYRNFKGPSYQLKCLKACVSGKPRVKLVVKRIPVKRLKYIRRADKETSGVFCEVEPEMDGNRIINLELLRKHVTSITCHSAICEGAKKVALNGNSPVSLVSEERHGLACILKAKCNGCGKFFDLNNSETVETSVGKQYDINVRGVWGSMVTGGGCSSLNESLGELSVYINITYKHMYVK